MLELAIGIILGCCAHIFPCVRQPFFMPKIFYYGTIK